MKTERNNNKEFIFKDFNEGEIKFLPSSKYEEGSNKIDCTNKDNKYLKKFKINFLYI